MVKILFILQDVHLFMRQHNCPQVSRVRMLEMSQNLLIKPQIPDSPIANQDYESNPNYDQ